MPRIAASRTRSGGRAEPIVDAESNLADGRFGVGADATDTGTTVAAAVSGRRLGQSPKLAYSAHDTDNIDDIDGEVCATQLESAQTPSTRRRQRE
jgi:hypothetical protein